MLPYKERNLLHVFETFQITAANKGLDAGVLDLSKEYYVALTANCQKRGLSRSAILASCVFSALKQVGQPRKPKDVADMFNIKTSDFTKAFKYVQEVLALAYQKGHLKGFSGSPSAQHTTRASHYIAHPLSKLPLKRAEFGVVLSLATAIANTAEDMSLCSEHMPPSLAAAALAEAIKLKRGSGVATPPNPPGGDKSPPNPPMMVSGGASSSSGGGLGGGSAPPTPETISAETIASLCDVSVGTLLKCWKRIEDTKSQWAAACGIVLSVESVDTK
jgi:transcription initiation factor TFIIIB Brf1 subunit/transcription initiation factor TFIIB